MASLDAQKGSGINTVCYCYGLAHTFGIVGCTAAIGSSEAQPTPPSPPPREQRLLEHLNSIASWPEGPKVNGSFDEPVSAEIARLAIAEYLAQPPAPPSGEIEAIAAELHDQYLATAKRLGWPVKSTVDVPYEQLSEDAKELDRVFARWHLARLNAAPPSVSAGSDEQEIKRLRDALEAVKRMGGPRSFACACYDTAVAALSRAPEGTAPEGEEA